ncbi:MAG: MarR family transcriptional regulator [Bryobacteraceae bacterium]
MFPAQPLSARVSAGLAKISLLLRQHLWQAAGARALTPTQAQALAALASRPPQGLRLQEIAELLAVTPATASDAVAALVSKGLVARRPDPEDARAARFRLTARGRRTAEAVAQWPDYLLQAVDSLPAVQQEQLLAALMGLVRSLQLQGRIPVARMCTNCAYFEPDRFPGSPEPHYCAFVQAPFGVPQFQLDCPDFHAAPEEAQAANQRVLISISLKGASDGKRDHSGI